MRAGMLLHGLLRYRGSGRLRQTIRVLIALILRLRRARALLRPLVGETVLLSDPHLILKPKLDRGSRCELAHKSDARRKVFF
jgi:hypothetical protein